MINEAGQHWVYTDSLMESHQAHCLAPFYFFLKGHVLTHQRYTNDAQTPGHFTKCGSSSAKTVLQSPLIKPCNNRQNLDAVIILLMVWVTLGSGQVL